MDDSPLPVADPIQIAEDTTGSTRIIANDPDQGDTFTYSLLTGPDKGTVTVLDTGIVTYTPNSDQYGDDEFIIAVTDSTGQSGTVHISVTIDPVNDPPCAINDEVAVHEDGTLIIYNLLSNDTDTDGDPLEIVGFTQPFHGNVQNNDDGTFTYIPDKDYNGQDSFTYTISDSSGYRSTGIVSVTIHPENDPPAVFAPPVCTYEDSSVCTHIDVVDPDDGDSFSYTITAAPLNGRADISGTGLLTYTPDTDYNGSDTLTVQVMDTHGDKESVSVNITVWPLNDAPVLTASDISIVKDSVGTSQISVYDPDDGDKATLILSETPQHGTAVISDSGLVTYTPEAWYSGSDSIRVTAYDGHPGGQSFITIGVNVTPAAILKGDVNGDSQVDLIDAVLALRVLTGDSPSVDKASDMDGDGRIGLKEAVFILQDISLRDDR